MSYDTRQTVDWKRISQFFQNAFWVDQRPKRQQAKRDLSHWFPFHFLPYLAQYGLCISIVQDELCQFLNLGRRSPGSPTRSGGNSKNARIPLPEQPPPKEIVSQTGTSAVSHSRKAVPYPFLPPPCRWLWPRKSKLYTKFLTKKLIISVVFPCARPGEHVTLPFILNRKTKRKEILVIIHVL